VSFPTPANEVGRLAALRALDIVDSAPEIAYDEAHLHPKSSKSSGASLRAAASTLSSR
jgi:hypothetical protein